MSEQIDDKLQEAKEALERLGELRDRAEFRDGEERSQLLQEALLSGVEALYRQNEVLVELLKTRE